MPNFALADLFGVDFLKRGDFTFPYFQFRDSPLTNDLPRRPLPHYMAMWEVRTNSLDVKVAATRCNPMIETSGETYYHNNQPPPDTDTGDVVVVYRPYGKGRVVYCAALPESNYARLGHAPYRHLISNMITWAADSLPLVRANGLLNTEIVTNRLGPDLIVHLVTGFPQRSVRFGLHHTSDTIEECVAIADVRLNIPTTVTSVTVIPGGQSLPIDRTSFAASVTIPSLGDWMTLRLVGTFE